MEITLGYPKTFGSFFYCNNEGNSPLVSPYHIHQHQTKIKTKRKLSGSRGKYKGKTIRRKTTWAYHSVSTLGGQPKNE
jgi:hypothetical protein